MNPGDLTTLANAKEWLGLSGVAISNITNASPAVVTLAAAPPAPLSSGLVVGLDAVNGMTEVNDHEYVITVIDPTHFSIPVNAIFFGAYTSGGIAGLADSLMQRLVSAVSAYIQSVLNRTIRNLDYTETHDGLGNPVMMPWNYPITSVAALTIDGNPIQARPVLKPTQTGTNLGGYSFSQTMLQLTGWTFCRGYQNVVVQYAAGFLISDEPQTIPGTAPYVLTTLARWNAGDRGVKYASSGLALAAVAANPTLGQYSVDANGVYTFSAADAGVAVLISYGYVPFDLEQAAVDMIGDWFKYRSRIGTLSMSIEQQSITFVNTALTSRAQGVINQYKRVAPFSP
jgi:hypothetical protein